MTEPLAKVLKELRLCCSVSPRLYCRWCGIKLCAECDMITPNDPVGCPERKADDIHQWRMYYPPGVDDYV